jgi:hypothetical protein
MLTLTVRDEISLTPEEREALGNKSTLDNFAHYAKYSSAKTQLLFAKVYRGDEFLGLAPVVKLVKHKTTELLRPEKRKWMGPVFGRLSKKTTYMVDSAFLAFEYRNPFFCPNEQDEETVRTAISNHLQKKTDVDTVLLTEPQRDTAWAKRHGYDCFSVSPMVHVDLSGYTTVESYIAALSRKRRKNWRADRKTFDENGGTLGFYDAPIPPAVLEEMHACLLKSASLNGLCVPYEDVQNSKQAFFGQDQRTLVAKVGGKVTGFFSFFPNGEALQQCHGGFNYDDSHRVKAYANLINAAIEHAINHGFKRLTMGPLNNETKRRAGSHLMPVMASLWCRDAIGRFVTRKLFLKNFQIYMGDAHAELAQPFEGPGCNPSPPSRSAVGK